MSSILLRMKFNYAVTRFWHGAVLAAAFFAAAHSSLHAQTDDYGDTFATAAPVSLNATVSGVLGAITDADYFRVTLTTATRLIVYTTGSVNTVGSLRSDRDVEILGNDNFGTDGNFRIESDLPVGTYYIRVTGFAGAIGSYTLRVETAFPVTDDHGNTAATATLISTNSTTTGLLYPYNDIDYFKIVLPAPASLFVISSGTPSTTGRLHDANDQLIAVSNADGASVNFRIQQELGAGTYYILVSSSGIGPYVLTVQASIRPNPPTVTTAAAGNVSLTSAVFGGNVTDAGGAIVTQRGAVYGTTLNPVAGSPAFVTLVSGSGTGAFTATSGALTPGTRYYLRAFAANSAGVGYGNQVEFSTPDDHGDNPETATIVGGATSIDGILTSTEDVDYFRLVMSEQGRLVVFTTGSVDTSGTLRDESDREIVGANEGGAGANFRLERNVAAGTYYVRVSGGNGATGSYTLHMERTTLATVVTAVPADVAPYGAILGGAISGDGGTPVTQRGVVFGAQRNPAVGSAILASGGSGNGSYAVNVALAAETLYYARAFAVNSAGIAYGSEVQFVTPSGARIVNLSIRARAGDGDQSLLLGFSLAGTGAKQLLLRAIGPSLTSFGVNGALPDPLLQLFSPFTAIASNEDWGGGAILTAAATRVGAFPLAAGSKDAAMLQTLPTGGYTARVGGGNGVALVELYDAGPNWTPRLVNVSARTQLVAGDILIAGFSVGGAGSRTVLIRAIGPTLANFQISGAMADPRIELFRSGAATSIATSDNWGGSVALRAAFEQVGAFALPSDSRDAALLMTLPVGTYTVQVSGVGATGGVVLVEIYEAP